MNANERGCNTCIMDSKCTHDPLHLDLCGAEVQQEAQGQACHFQVVQALGKVRVVQFLDGLQFDQQHAFDKDIGRIFPPTTTPS